MNRRELLKGAAVGALAIVGANGIVWAGEYYPVKVKEKLFEGINTPENSKDEAGLAKLHIPVITAPEKVTAGEVFPVEISVGEIVHPMGPNHWIENAQVNIGNEPAGNLVFRSHGYMKPAGRFNLALDEDLRGKMISLVVQIQCNLHGIWQSHADLQVA